jgi:hypothetical protein
MANIILQHDLHAISPAEATKKAFEDTAKLAAKNKHPDQALLENRDMARGYEMEVGDLITKIQKLNPRIQIRKGGVKNAVAVYIPVPVSEANPLGLKYTSGFYIDSRLSEYSSVTVDQFGVAHKETRGWRTVLLSLIEAGALDRRKVDLAFGPALGKRTDLWYRALQANEK